MPTFAKGPAFSGGGGVAPLPPGDLVFITAGQSNAANYAKPLDTSVPGVNVLASGLTGPTFSQAFDPQPVADNTFSSPWPRLGDALYARTGRRIKFISVGQGNTQISQWVPGQANYNKIKSAVQLFPVNGFTAFLWHQGENDASFGTSQSAYSSALISIINQLRADAGWNAPCGIAIATHPNEATGAGVIAAQTSVGTTYYACFQGANTDTLGNTFRQVDNTHFTTPTGTTAHANLWYNAIVGYFGL